MTNSNELLRAPLNDAQKHQQKLDDLARLEQENNPPPMPELTSAENTKALFEERIKHEFEKQIEKSERQ